MHSVIPELAAQHWLDEFTVLTVANPYVDRQAREDILGSWRELIAAKVRRVKAHLQAPETRKDMPLREVARIIKEAFGRGIKTEG